MQVRAFLLVSVLGVVLVACSPSTAGAITPQQTDPHSGNVITVTGSGRASGAPDVATVELGVQERSEDVSEALEGTNMVIDDITAALLDLGVTEENIQTANFSVWQDRPRNPETGEPNGPEVFIVENTVRVRVDDISQISAVIDAGLDAGATQVYGLNFSLDDPTTLESEARQAAVDHARARAEELAGMLGVELGEVVAVNEGTAGGGYSGPTFEAEDAGGGPSISEGQLSVGVTVTISYAIGN